jgi:hypothetical protein
MLTCPICNTEMKPLATWVFCPNGCDRPATERSTPAEADFARFVMCEKTWEIFKINAVSSLPDLTLGWTSSWYLSKGPRVNPTECDVSSAADLAAVWASQTSWFTTPGTPTAPHHIKMGVEQASAGEIDGYTIFRKVTP